MPQRGVLPATLQVVVALGTQLLMSADAQAQTPSGQNSALDMLGVIGLVALAPLLPLLAGAGFYLLTRSHLVAVGLSAFAFGVWGAWEFSRTSVDGPLSGALFGLGFEGVGGGILALTGSGYVHLIGAETRKLGGKRTAVAHGVGLAFAAVAFVLLLVTQGSDKVGAGLYAAGLALSLAVSAATGVFGGVAATMAVALVAMVHGIWGAALLSGVRDAGQAYIAIVYVPPALAPLVGLAGLGAWLGRSVRARQPA